MVLLVFLVHLELGTHCTHHCIQRFRLLGFLGFLGFVKTCPGPAVEATDPTRCFASEILVHRATLGILGFLLASLHDPARMRFVKQGHHTSMQNDIQHWHIGKAPVILAAVGSSWQLTLGLIISSPHAWKTSGILYTVTFTSMCQDPMDVFLGMTDFLVPVLGFILAVGIGRRSTCLPPRTGGANCVDDVLHRVAEARRWTSLHRSFLGFGHLLDISGLRMKIG